jgi:hypothetical protein
MSLSCFNIFNKNLLKEKIDIELLFIIIIKIFKMTNLIEEITWTIDRTPDYSLLLQYCYYEFINICYSNSEIDPDTNCCICMEERKKGEICLFNCKHSFCVYCVKKSLNIHKELICCPLCRQSVYNIMFQK